jgi:Predicted membrane protein
MSDPVRRTGENLPEIVAVSITGVWLTALFTGQDWWLPLMIFGYIVIVPITELLFGDQEETEERWDEAEDISAPEESSAEDPLETLRERYVQDELTDEEFERKLERLLETESIEDVQAQNQHNRDRLDQELER